MADKVFFISQKVLLAAMLFAMQLTAVGQDDITQDSLVKNSIDCAHQLLWTHFMDMENGLLFDYVDSEGPTAVPTPHECRMHLPNALSWWVPNENGAFFNGLYLQAVCDRWKFQKDEVTESRARKLASGLILLSNVGRTAGFIARGVSTDGVTHFPLSSVDQTYPWFYGLWKYAQSGLVNNVERSAIIDMMEFNALALDSYNWGIPCEDSIFGYFGGFSGAGFSDAARLLSILKFMHHLTGNDYWNTLYNEKLTEIPAHSEHSRLDILAGGIVYDPSLDHHSFWTSSMDQAALLELYLLEEREHIRSRFRQGLDQNARNAARHIADYAKFDNQTQLGFSPDWRLLNPLWRPQKSWEEAWELADEQLVLWDSISPRKGYELAFMMEPLNAAWIVALSGNREIMDSVKHHINNALSHYNWSTMSYSTFFIAECVYYTLYDMQQDGAFQDEYLDGL